MKYLYAILACTGIIFIWLVIGFMLEIDYGFIGKIILFATLFITWLTITKKGKVNNKKTKA